MTQKQVSRFQSADAQAREGFGKDYYRRFYLDPATRVRDGGAQDRLAGFVFGYLAHLDIPIRRVLDLGCGLGHWRDSLAKHHARASYTGVEVSPYLCRECGWEEGSAADYAGRGRFDLVICQSVLQYLSDAGARRALANIARLCRGAVYLEIITAEDWRDNCDQKVTDGNVRFRPAAWYRKELRRHFRSAGGGVFLPLDSNVVLYELEQGRE